jgi:glycerol transport system substrate-binding protein
VATPTVLPLYALRKWWSGYKYARPVRSAWTPSSTELGEGQRRATDLLVHGVYCLVVEPKSKGNNTVDDKGAPLWRMAPSPHGPYWENGQKLGYQDAGSWTLLKSTPVDRRKAAWLFAQFTVSKTVDVKKSHTGLTFIRDSTVKHQSFTDRAPKLGGLVEFYRSPARVMWTPSGTNVPDYPKLAQLWWQNIGWSLVRYSAAMDNLAEEMDKVMARPGALAGEWDEAHQLVAESQWLGAGTQSQARNEKPKGEPCSMKIAPSLKEGRAM